MASVFKAFAVFSVFLVILFQCTSSQLVPRVDLALTDNLNYIKQFEHGRSRLQPQPNPITEEPERHEVKLSEEDSQEDALTELFRQFLKQQGPKAASELLKIQTSTVSTPTTTDAPLKISFPRTRPSLKLAKVLTISTTPKTPIQLRRLSLKRKSNIPIAAVTQTSTTTTSTTPEPTKPSTAPLAKIASRLSPTPEKDLESQFNQEEFKRQAESAKYEFASNIQDQLSGNSHQREEVRNGLAVKGKYSYSDGYYKRTVNYEADDKGYRVVKLVKAPLSVGYSLSQDIREEIEPLSGPQINPHGHAKVSSYVAGNTVNYEITKDDILNPEQKVVYTNLDEINDRVADEITYD